LLEEHLYDAGFISFELCVDADHFAVYQFILFTESDSLYFFL
jgi:hypothetical protein